MKFEMRSPCSLCPFRNDDGRLSVDPYRLRAFAYSPGFVCHQTAEIKEPCDEDEREQSGFVGKDDGTSQHCAGAMIFLEHLGEPNQCMQIAERFGLYDPANLDMDAPVFRSWAEVTAN